MWINSSETLPLSFLLYACFDPSLFVTKYAFLSERVWAIWNQVVLSTSIYWAFTVCYTLLGRDEAKIDEWIRVKLAESTRRALCAFFKTPLQRSHFSPSLPQEGFQIMLSNFLTRLAMGEVLVMQISPLLYIYLDDLGFLLDWQVGKQQSRPLICCELFCEDFMSVY